MRRQPADPNGQHPVRLDAAGNFDRNEVVRHSACTLPGGHFFRRGQRDGTQVFADEFCPKVEVLSLGQGAQGGHAFGDRCDGNRVVAVELPSGRAGAGRKREQMQVGEGLGGDEVAALLEERVGFAGETDHDVGSDGRIGQCGADGDGSLRVVPGAVAPVHFSEDRVRPGLQRQVGVRRQARMLAGGEFSKEGEQFGSPVHRLDGAEAQAREAGLAEDGGDEIDEVQRRRQIASPSAKIYSREDEFLTARRRESADIVKAGFERDGAAGTACGRDYAEGAAMIAAVLDFEVRAGLVGVGGKRQSGEFGMSEILVYENFREYFHRRPGYS